MEIICRISIGEIIQVILTFLALIGAVWLYKTQITLNKKLLNIEKFVEVTAVLSSNIMTADKKTYMHSILTMNNMSKTPLRILEYTYSGNTYPDIDALIYQTATYYIELPTVIDGTPFNNIEHVYIELKISDDDKNAYTKKINVTFKNGRWVTKEYRLAK